MVSVGAPVLVGIISLGLAPGTFVSCGAVFLIFVAVGEGEKPEEKQAERGMEINRRKVPIHQTTLLLIRRNDRFMKTSLK